MKLILVRHADAVSLGHDGLTSDAERPLSDLGYKQIAAIALALKSAHISVGAILTSPLTRAKETALALASLCAGAREPDETDLLALGNYHPRKLMNYVKSLEVNPVILVGHMPNLGQFAGWLLGAPPTAFEFTRAAACLIDTPRKTPKGKGTLRWLITPHFVPEAKSNQEMEVSDRPLT